MMTIRTYRQEDEAELALAANSDNHIVCRPTHVALKDGKIVGYASVGAVPMVLIWSSTKENNVKDSLHALGYIEGMCQQFGAVAIPCTQDSPFYKYFEELGYTKTHDCSLFIKALNV